MTNDLMARLVAAEAICRAVETEQPRFVPALHDYRCDCLRCRPPSVVEWAQYMRRVTTPLIAAWRAAGGGR